LSIHPGALQVVGDISGDELICNICLNPNDGPGKFLSVPPFTEEWTREPFIDIGKTEQ
jgi:hypothetical protein